MDNAERKEEAPSGGAAVFLSWFARLAGIGALAVSAAGLFLHLCGYVAQRTYLHVFNVDPDVFPRSTDWLMVNGYYTAMDRTAWLLDNVPLALALGITCYVAVLVFVARWKPARKQSPARVARWWLPAPFKLAASSFAYATLSLSAAYMALLLAVLFLLVPAAIGESAGQAKAKDDLRRFLEGCDAASRCAEIWRQEARLATGFVIATSLDHVAIFEPDQRRVRVIEREGTDLLVGIDAKWLAETGH